MSDYEKLMLLHASAQTGLLHGLLRSKLIPESKESNDVEALILSLCRATDKFIKDQEESRALNVEDFGEPPSPI